MCFNLIYEMLHLKYQRGTLRYFKVYGLYLHEYDIFDERNPNLDVLYDSTHFYVWMEKSLLHVAGCVKKYLFLAKIFFLTFLKTPYRSPL